MEIKKNYPLAPNTTVKIGGPAETFITTNSTAEFIDALTNSSQPITVLGNGSNTLISDSGVKGTVVKNQSNIIEYLPNNQVKVDSGVQLPFLITDTINHSLSGLEEFAYIPSTIGGAIYGNIHGVKNNNFDIFITEIEIFNLNSKELKKYDPKSLDWSYDTSEFKNHPEWIILNTTLQLNPGDSDISKQIVIETITKKIKVQSMNSLGSVFKNPKNDFAGRIIDQELGLKSFQIGDAQVSPLHSNFILNLGHATASDYFSLIKKIQSDALAKGFILEPEITFLGNF